MRIVLVILIMMFSSTVSAATIEEIRKSMEIQHGVIRATDPDGSLKIEYFKSAKNSGAGFYIVKMRHKYFDIFRDLYNTPNTIKTGRFGQACNFGGGFAPIGHLQESPHRETYFYSREGKFSVMLTRWDVTKDHAQVLFPSYLINDRVDHNEAVTVLTLPEDVNANRAIWKTVWHFDNKLFELYVESELLKNGVVDYPKSKLDYLLGHLNCK